MAAGAVLGGAAHSLASAEATPVAAFDVMAATTLDAGALEARLAGALLRADVEACGLHRQGTVTMVSDNGETAGLTNAHVTQGADSVDLSGAGLGVDEGSVQGYLAGRDAAEVGLDGLAPDHVRGPGIRTDPHARGSGGRRRVPRGPLERRRGARRVDRTTRGVGRHEHRHGHRRPGGGGDIGWCGGRSQRQGSGADSRSGSGQRLGCGISDDGHHVPCTR